MASRRRPLPFDPIDEAARQWQARWDGAEAMKVATSVMRVQQLLLARIDAALRPLELTFSRYEALVLLVFSRRGELPMNKMGERLMIHPTSVTNIVDRLQQQGLVQRRSHPSDRRTTLVSITPEGRRLATKATDALVDIGFGLDGLGDSQLADVYESLRQVRTAAGDIPSGDGRPPTGASVDG